MYTSFSLLPNTELALLKYLFSAWMMLKENYKGLLESNYQKTPRKTTLPQDFAQFGGLSYGLELGLEEILFFFFLNSRMICTHFKTDEI